MWLWFWFGASVLCAGIIAGNVVPSEPEASFGFGWMLAGMVVCAIANVPILVIVVLLAKITRNTSAARDPLASPGSPQG